MANASFLKRFCNTSAQLIHSNPTRFTPKPQLNPTQNPITRPFATTPIFLKLRPDPTPESDPEPTETDPVPSPAPNGSVPISDESKGPKNLLVELYKMRTSGLLTQAPKVFDNMSKRLRPFNNNRRMSHEKMDMFRGGYNRMPDVVSHIAVMEAYANAGENNKKAQKEYLKMLGPCVIPNEHTYNALIKLLGSSRDWSMIGQSQKYLLEMLDKGIMPSAEAFVAVLKALAREGKVREGRDLVEDIKERGFVVDADVFKEVVKCRSGAIKLLKSKNGRVLRSVLEILFAKKI